MPPRPWGAHTLPRYATYLAELPNPRRRYFEVNYASFDASALDVLFGTYRDCFADADEKNADKGLPAIPDAKAALGVPPLSEVVYALGVAAGFLPWYAACAAGGAPAWWWPSGHPAATPAAHALLLGALAGLAPIALAYALPRSGAVGGAKDKGVVANTLLWCLGVLSSALPVGYASALCLIGK